MMMTSNTTQGTSTVQATTGTTFIATFSDNNPSVHEAVTGSTTEKIMIFRNAGVDHTFTVPSGGLNCDVLMIGGGGGCGGSGASAGAGACIVAINQTLPAGSCIVYVGAGGDGSGTNGVNSYIYDGGYRYRAQGGGGTTSSANGLSGGCGGSALFNSGGIGGAAVGTNVVSLNDGTTTTTVPSIDNTHRYAVMGYAGSAAIGGSLIGGGGIGGTGGANTPGVGKYNVAINGTTYNFRDWFANGGNNFGVLSGGVYYIGSGGLYANPGVSTIANTGNGSSGYTYIGGSGIVIIRYRSGTTTTTYTHTPTSTTTLTTTLGTPSIELVRGTQGDSNTDYKIGNYSGDFIVKSSVSGVETDYLKISSTGAITNPTGTASWNTGSDRRIKENIARASYDKCYESICRLELNRFNYIKGFNTVNRDITQLGFIAQEVNDIFPKAISSQPYNSDTLNIPDLLSIDVSQINYALYGTVKKLIEINNNKELRLKKLECLLNIESDGGSSSDSSNLVIMEDVLSSNVVIMDDVLSSNVVIMEDVLSSNVVIEDTMTSNVVIIEDTMTSNVVIEDTMTSNVVIENTMTSNVVIEDTMTSNVVIEDTMTSNVVIEDTNNI